MKLFIIVLAVAGVAGVVGLIVALHDAWVMWREETRVSAAWRADQMRNRRGFDDDTAA